MPDLHIHLQPSYRLVTILSLAHSAVAILLWPLALSWGVKAILVTLLLISLIYYLRKDALLVANNAVVALTLTDEMSCVLAMRSGRLMACSVLGNSFVAPYLTVINLQSEGKFCERSVVILPDSLGAEEFRRLRVWLRWRWKSDQDG